MKIDKHESKLKEHEENIERCVQSGATRKYDIIFTSISLSFQKARSLLTIQW